MQRHAPPFFWASWGLFHGANLSGLLTASHAINRHAMAPTGNFSMNILLSAFHVVHDYPGGAVALGPMLGKNPATLSHEVNPNCVGAKMGLEDAVKLSVLTQDRRIATAFAAQVGCMLMPLPDMPRAGTSFEALAGMAREFAELVATVTEAAADGRVSPNELRRVEAEAAQLVVSVQSTVAHVAALAQRRREQVTNG